MNPFYNTQHAPIGAFATFTLGYPGKSGGLGMEIGQPSNQNVYIGLATRPGGAYQALPFWQAVDDPQRWFDPEGRLGEPEKSGNLSPFSAQDIRRELGPATDTWMAGDLTFRLISATTGIPDPEQADPEMLKDVLIPCIFAELSVDNRAGSCTRRAFLGFQVDARSGDAMRHLVMDGLAAIGQGTQTMIIACQPGAWAMQGWDIERILATSENSIDWGLGHSAALFVETPAGEKRTFRFAICFYKSGNVTASIPSTYFYTRLFPTIEAVAAYATEHSERLIEFWEQGDAAVAQALLSQAQKWMLAQAIHSYYASTQLLDMDGKPVWVVNEGEYRMMNTLDLTVDQLFYELRQNPWTVRNVLDLFVERYSYQDQVQEANTGQIFPGGISFTHDMGVANVFSPAGRSSYEVPDQTGVFSFMTAEQLVNWVLCAGLYLAQTGDNAWRNARSPILRACLESLMRRDHPNPQLRDGVMDLDSAKTGTGSEITTYDSLDASLGQARRNVYLAGKTWAAYLLMEKIFTDAGDGDRAEVAHQQALLCAGTLTKSASSQSSLPAILGENVNSVIIPAIEGLAYVKAAGLNGTLNPQGEFSDYLQVLRKHLELALQPGRCLFSDGGWKLSSSSNNSWLSKIYLNQFVAREILGFEQDQSFDAADEAHAGWLVRPENAYWAWSDQMVNGVASGSRYYPRGVTAILWLSEKGGAQ